MLSISKKSVTEMILRHRKCLFELYEVLGVKDDYVEDLCKIVGVTKKQLAVTLAISNEISMKELANVINVDYSTIRRWPEIRSIYSRKATNYYRSDSELGFDE